MENGGCGYDGDGDGDGGAHLEREFSCLTITPPATVAAAAAAAVPDTMANNSNSNTDGLFQVMKAVEAAEATIKQQVEENNRLRSELQKKIQELGKYKSDESKGRNPHMIGNYAGHIDGSQIVHQSVPVLASLTDGIRSIDNTFRHDASDAMIQKYLPQNIEDHVMQTHVDSHSEKNYINGAVKMLKDDQAASDNVGFSQFSSPSTTSFSPSRYQTEGEYDPHLNSSGHGLMPMPMTEINNSRILLKQDLGLNLREHEEEILQLRKHLADYSIKEAQICNEKYVLENRIAYMRMAFDQQQQDLVDAASKALSYRQDIIEENIRLTYALQTAQQERSTFVSSLMPLLAEYSLQPANADAQSIVSNLKVLFKHLQEKLIITEEKLKESQYQLGPWRADVNPSHFSPSPSHFIGYQNGLELVPQPAYSNEKKPVSLDPLATTDWDVVGHRQGGFNDVTNNRLPDDLAKYSPLTSRNTGHQEAPAKLGVSQDELHPLRNSEEVANKQVTFSDPVSSSEMDDPDMDGQHNEGEAFVNWDSKTSPYSTTLEDNTLSYSPFLPPVLEEPSSSLSEDPAPEDDLLPAIEDLQISGEALPGQELQACGYSINGTTSCNFEWVRHLEDGSVNYIDGAKQPNYLVTADDVDTYLAIEVQPLDERKRKGELVKVFANEHRKITCDPEMQSHIEQTLYTGHASFRVSLSTGYLDIWEPATLAIKREGYSIKCTGPNAVITEKFSPATIVSIPYGHPTAFSISGSGGVERVLRAEGSSTDISCSRDTIVLTLRLFIIKAGDRKKGKKRGIFFNK